LEGGQSSGEDGTMSSTIRISSNNNAEGDQHSVGNSRTRRYDDKRMYMIQHGGSLVVRGESTALVCIHLLLSMDIVVLLYKVLNSFSCIYYFA